VLFHRGWSRFGDGDTGGGVGQSGTGKEVEAGGKGGEGEAGGGRSTRGAKGSQGERKHLKEKSQDEGTGEEAVERIMGASLQRGFSG